MRPLQPEHVSHSILLVNPAPNIFCAPCRDPNRQANRGGEYAVVDASPKRGLGKRDEAQQQLLANETRLGQCGPLGLMASG